MAKPFLYLAAEETATPFMVLAWSILVMDEHGTMNYSEHEHELF